MVCRRFVSSGWSRLLRLPCALQLVDATSPSDCYVVLCCAYSGDESHVLDPSIGAEQGIEQGGSQAFGSDSNGGNNVHSFEVREGWALAEPARHAQRCVQPCWPRFRSGSCTAISCARCIIYLRIAWLAFALAGAVSRQACAQQMPLMHAECHAMPR